MTERIFFLTIDCFISIMMFLKKERNKHQFPKLDLCQILIKKHFRPMSRCYERRIISTRKLSCGKVMFSQVSVCNSVEGPVKRGQRGMWSPHTRRHTPRIHVPCPLPSDIWWPRLETCPKLFNCGLTSSMLTFYG